MEPKQDKLLAKSINNQALDDDAPAPNFCSILKHKSFALLLPYYALLEIASYQRFVFIAAYGAAYLSGCHSIKENNHCHNDFKYDEYNIYYNISNSVAGGLAFLFAGFVGSTSDHIGRKPFLFIQWIITVIPYVIMLFYNNLFVFLALFSLIGINGLS